ncbi:MAG: CIA30 family protein [Pseudomonadota bacterium]
MADPVDLFDPAAWMFVSDGVMGGISEGDVSAVDAEGSLALRLTGVVRTENNGGFIQMRRTLEVALPSNTSALRLTVRGNGERYFVHLRTPARQRPWHYYRAPFDTGPDWREVTLPLKDFRPSRPEMPATFAAPDIQVIGLAAIGRAHRADLWLAAIDAV